MDTIPKHKLGATISIDKWKVLEFFNPYIDHKVEDSEKETYVCKDNSLLILQQSDTDGKVFVKFHLNLLIDASRKSVSIQGKVWFMEFCKEHHSEIQNLRTGVVMPVSDGAIMSDIFTSEAFRLAKHYSQHPNDQNNKKTTNR